MSRRRRDAGLLSLLDLFACGLGAAVLLGLELMIVRQRPPVDRSPSSAVLLRVSVDDPSALLALVLRHESGARWEQDLRTLAGSASGCGGTPCTVLGFSHEGSTELDETPNAHGRSYVVHLEGPAAGSWEVGVRYFNRDIPADDWTRWSDEVAATVKLARWELFRAYAPKPINECASSAPELRLGEVASCKFVVPAR